MRTWIISCAAVIGLSTLVLFQNCAGQAFQAQDLLTVSCEGGVCNESLDAGRGGDIVYSQTDSGADEYTAGADGAGMYNPGRSENSSGENGTSSESHESSSLYNVVHGGGKAACEQTIAEHFGIRYNCSLGGGCGVSCGKPGGNCASANPQHYGACLSQTDIANAPPAGSQMSSEQLFNFVAGSGKAACEQLIAQSKGVRGTCTLGGGCGISCGKPGANCPSANPQHYGACYSAEDLARLPAATAASQPTLYNFVAGDKATCERSIRDRLGLTVSCRVGGGCGVSCGMPSATCPSANPSYYGACIQH